jgi:deubiquitinase DESI2
MADKDDNDEDEAKHLLPAPSNDQLSVDVPPKLAKDLL